MQYCRADGQEMRFAMPRITPGTASCEAICLPGPNDECCNLDVMHGGTDDG